MLSNIILQLVSAAYHTHKTVTRIYKFRQIGGKMYMHNMYRLEILETILTMQGVLE